MRRFFWGFAIASLTVSAPVTAFGGDQDIANEIITTIKSQQANGSLKGFDIDLQVESGVVMLSGTVANDEQANAVMAAAYGTPGVREVVDKMRVRQSLRSAPRSTPLAMEAHESPSKNIRRASNTEPVGDAPLMMNTGTEEVSEWQTTVAELPKLSLKNSSPLPSQSGTSQTTIADSAITNEALSKLSQAKAAGSLRQFELDLSTENGEIWARGHVANAQQKQLVLRTLQYVRGVKKVIDEISIQGQPESGVRPASDSVPVPSQHASMPIVGHTNAVPRPFAPSGMTSYDSVVPSAPVATGAVSGEGLMQTPVPMNMGPSYGPGVPRHDTPQMPGYAWPSYAAYPNYAAVTYPKQYSASAWPYIGPFYPYPQVPLGWRRVALEWDDGLWYLDFTSK